MPNGGFYVYYPSNIFRNSHSFVKLGNIYISLDVLVCCINLLLTERKGGTEEYWPDVVAVARGPYENDRVLLELARLVSSLLCGTWAMFVLNLPAFENKKKKGKEGKCDSFAASRFSVQITVQYRCLFVLLFKRVFG